MNGQCYKVLPVNKQKLHMNGQCYKVLPVNKQKLHMNGQCYILSYDRIYILCNKYTCTLPENINLICTEF